MFKTLRKIYHYLRRENNYLRRGLEWTDDDFQDGTEWNTTTSFFSGGQMVANFGVPNEKFVLKARA